MTSRVTWAQRRWPCWILWERRNSICLCRLNISCRLLWFPCSCAWYSIIKVCSQVLSSKILEERKHKHREKSETTLPLPSILIFNRYINVYTIADKLLNGKLINLLITILSLERKCRLNMSFKIIGPLQTLLKKIFEELRKCAHFPDRLTENWLIR